MDFESYMNQSHQSHANHTIGKNTEKCFPVVNGVVTVNCPEFKGELKVFPKIFIVDAYEDVDGLIIHALKGQSQEALVKGIFINVCTDDMVDARAATCRYLRELQVAIEVGETYVQTRFGLKYIDRRQLKRVPTGNKDWSKED